MTAAFQLYYCPDTVKSRSKLGKIQQKPELPYLNSSFPLLCSVSLFSLISISSDRKPHRLEGAPSEAEAQGAQHLLHTTTEFFENFLKLF